MTADEQEVLNLIDASAAVGATRAEIVGSLGLSWMRAGRALASLIHSGALVGLSLRRRDHRVYVVPGDVQGRQIAIQSVRDNSDQTDEGNNMDDATDHDREGGPTDTPESEARTQHKEGDGEHTWAELPDQASEHERAFREALANGTILGPFQLSELSELLGTDEPDDGSLRNEQKRRVAALTEAKALLLTRSSPAGPLTSRGERAVAVVDLIRLADYILEGLDTA